MAQEPPSPVEQARRLAARGRSKDALTILEDARKEDPNDADAIAYWHFLNGVRGRVGWLEVDAAVRSVVAEAPSRLLPRVLAAQARFLSGSVRQGLDELRQLAAENPQNARVQRTLASLLVDSDPVEAWTAYRRSVELGPDLEGPAVRRSALIAGRKAHASRDERRRVLHGAGIAERAAVLTVATPVLYVLVRYGGAVIVFVGLALGSLPLALVGAGLVSWLMVVGGLFSGRVVSAVVVAIIWVGILGFALISLSHLPPKQRMPAVILFGAIGLIGGALAKDVAYSES